ncbi:glycosyltransferase [Nocardioides sp. MAHUQ-72]|uniref:glycosyltransferase n=1 Tax=unclassified Nocardioides TaxID=2615069 RepID=UPI0036127AC6
MIGYYVHHQGSGHLHRAAALATALDIPVTGLSSLPRPREWPGSWVDLARDDDGPLHQDLTAGGRLHWAPVRHPGLAFRMAEIASWIHHVSPELMVVDVSVEVALLARLLGIPVVLVVLPGSRGDAPHRLAFDTAEQLVALWPDQAPGMLRDVPAEVEERLRPIGALSRFPVRPGPVRRDRPEGSGRVTVLLGSGGDSVTPEQLAAARGQTPGWTWTVLGGAEGIWEEDPESAIADADVVVTHAGQNAVAEVAALRRPAIVVPQPRPHDEQVTTAAALRRGPWPVLVEDDLPVEGWAERLERATALDGDGWSSWCDGAAARRFAGIVESVLGGRR